jgi:hypothetical protein
MVQVKLGMKSNRLLISAMAMLLSVSLFGCQACNGQTPSTNISSFAPNITYTIEIEFDGINLLVPMGWFVDTKYEEGVPVRVTARQGRSNIFNALPTYGMVIDIFYHQRVQYLTGNDGDSAVVPGGDERIVREKHPFLAGPRQYETWRIPSLNIQIQARYDTETDKETIDAIFDSIQLPPAVNHSFPAA